MTPESTHIQTSTGKLYEDRSFAARGIFIVSLIAAVKFAIHIIFNNRYDYFRDELYYMACGNHLAWGYVDQPPMIPFLVRISRVVFGDSLRSIRFFPALASSAVVILTALITRELSRGAGNSGRESQADLVTNEPRFPMVLAAVCVLIAPIYLSDGSLLTTNCIEPLFWMGCVWFAILAINRNDPRFWLGFGVVAGLGLEEKYSIAVFGVGIVVGLILTPQRKFLASRWFWVGGAAAVLIFLPNFIWNTAHHWPFAEMMHNIRLDGRDVQLSPLEFFKQQALLVQPFTAPVWIAGLLALFFWRRLQPYRLLAWCYLCAFAIVALLKGKNYYLAPIYPMLFAAGGLTIDACIERIRQRWLRPLILAVLLLTGIWLAPLIIPILPVSNLISYLDHLPFKVPRTEHSHEGAALPQHFADQFGWREITASTADAWNRLSPEEKSDCPIFAQDYGQAGAIDFFGRQYGLPHAISGHQNYYLWGPQGFSGKCMIVLDDSHEKLDQLYESVEFIGLSADNPFALERKIPIFICRGPKFGTLNDVWPRVKKWR